MKQENIPFFFHGILKGRYEDEQDAELFGYELFTRGFNTFKREDGASIKGTLAMVPVEEVPELDMIEGFPSYYIRIQLPVVTDSGAIINAWVYQQAEDWINDMEFKMLSEAMAYV
mgnify:CR=1 FL=1